MAGIEWKPNQDYEVLTLSELRTEYLRLKRWRNQANSSSPWWVDSAYALAALMYALSQRYDDDTIRGLLRTWDHAVDG